MFLSVPLTMTIKIVLDTNEKTRWLGIMLGPEDEAEEVLPLDDKPDELVLEKQKSETETLPATNKE